MKIQQVTTAEFEQHKTNRQRKKLNKQQWQHLKGLLAFGQFWYYLKNKKGGMKR